MIYVLLLGSLMGLAGVAAGARRILAARRGQGPIVLHLQGASKSGTGRL